ncbi:MAG: MFS transporter, partial [Myxococcaceae bacterium]|nr:MFS transporter [Myxococcaceae bacterium]
TTVISALFAPLVFLVPSTSLMVVGAACWSVGMGAQDSIFKAAVAKLVPKEERGRAYGLFFAFFGLAWWIGSATMGWLYERSMTALVVFSVVTQLAAVPLLLFVGLRLRRLEGARR